MVDIKEIYAGILSGLHTEPPETTMGKKLIINVAPTGSYTNRQQNPLQPYTLEENVRAAIDACKAGAAVWHVHAREADGFPSKDPKVVKETIERVFEKCPDIVTSVIAYADYSQQGVEQIKPTVDLLAAAGPRYMQTSPLVIRPSSISEKYTYVITEKLLQGVVRYLEDHGVHPEYQCDAYGPQRHIEDWMIGTGIAKNPPIFNLMAGFHGRGFASPAGPNPWKYVYVASILESMPKGAVLGVCAGGRNWLPFTLFAIMLGVDMVRVGMEDCVYVHPHRDEKLKSSAQAVAMVVEMARILGREIATPDEAREILGVTSVKAARRNAKEGAAA
jgi:3-keto-5-aminohexanoate cleavage enzyme